VGALVAIAAPRCLPDAPNSEAFSLDLNPRAVQFDLLAFRPLSSPPPLP